MKKFRVLLFAPLVIAELVALATCWALVPFHRSTAMRLSDWATRVFPDLPWFIGA